ncbi:hypothetical protein [Flavobacterium sp. FlaQc-47]|uniref:hypothetical protein n=1 Tax=Flavobacterium sp. FlaQc-47 TaxID=3374180 RepID=UPI003757F935
MLTARTWGVILNNGQMDRYDINHEVTAYDIKPKIENGIAFDITDIMDIWLLNLTR